MPAHLASLLRRGLPPLLASALALLASAAVLAEKADRNKPLNVEADSGRYLTSPSMAGSPERALLVASFLIEKVRAKG